MTNGLCCLLDDFIHPHTNMQEHIQNNMKDINRIFLKRKEIRNETNVNQATLVLLRPDSSPETYDKEECLTVSIYYILPEDK